MTALATRVQVVEPIELDAVLCTRLAELAKMALAVKEAMGGRDWKLKCRLLEALGHECVQWRRQVIQEEAPGWVRDANPFSLAAIDPDERLRLERRSHGRHGTGLPQMAIKAMAVKEALQRGDWRAKCGALEDITRLCVQWRRVIIEDEAPAWVRQANRL